jgi:transposase
MNPEAAGIDIGATEIYVAIPPERDSESVRKFATFTRDLNALADWLTDRDPNSGDGVHWSLLDSIDANPRSLCGVSPSR